ncbi:MAG: M60 family metallopeptidase [Bacteroidaceae bacterium]|nr:M60 family metallopeptidase [Bacteroidaceae bacterium]
MKKLRRLWSALMLCALFVPAVLAQPEQGKVYNLKNVAKGTSLFMPSMISLGTTTTNESTRNQQWYVETIEGEKFTLRNLQTGRYVQGHNESSQRWTPASAPVELEYVATDNGYAIRQSGHTGHYAYLHADGSGNPVSWEYTGNNNSLWSFNEVAYDAATLESLLEGLQGIAQIEGNQSIYQEALNNLFADKACTELKKVYASESELLADVNYQNLTPTLQQMVRKVYSGDWAESNADANKSSWNREYAKKYRVQLYEPYNEPEGAAKALGINAHTNANNPTGIFVNAGEVAYVMVEGAIEDGAELYVVSTIGHNQVGGYADGVALHEGLNIIPAASDGSNLYINYVVHAFDTSDGKRGVKAVSRKLSDYEPLKIHIAGGYINGYWNRMGDKLWGVGDDADDWTYIAERATQHDVLILGKYMTLQFPLLSENAEGHPGMKDVYEQFDISASVAEWDAMMLWQRFVMGLSSAEELANSNFVSPYSGKKVFAHSGVDFSEYYNVHGLALSIKAGSNPHGAWAYSGYPCNSLINYNGDIITNAGAHWTAIHEIGHQHQSLLTLNGLTEVTNNLFANVALWCFGKSTSRYNGTDGALSNVLAAFNAEDGDFYTNNIWALTHMYYKLFLYYHVLGHNTEFYPRLFELLRQTPMNRQYEQTGTEGLLRFYELCCQAAGEDLTEFFRAYGVLTVMTDRLVGDYSNSVYNSSQADIDAAIERVKSKGYDENVAVLFINDGTGESILSHKGGTLELYAETRVCAEVGSYASFAANTKGNYTYALAGTTVTMKGEGGIGFAIYNDDHELIAFSDNKTFEVSSKVAELLAMGKVKVVSVSADNSESVAADEMEVADIEAKRALLASVLDIAKTSVIDLTDKTGVTKPGFYNASAIAAFTTAYNNAQTAYDAQDAAAYAAVYSALSEEILKLQNATGVTVPLLAGSTYVFTNKKYPEISMDANGGGNVRSEATDGSADQQWTLEPATGEDLFYIKSVGTGKYLGVLNKSAAIQATAEKSGAKAYKAFDLKNGLWAFQCQEEDDIANRSLHTDGGHAVVGWSHAASENDGSWWYLSATDVVADELPRFELQNLVAQTEALIADVATIQFVTEQQALTADDYRSNAECKNSSYGDQFTSYKVLCDNDPATFFHSDYSDQAPNEDHYIRMDLDEGIGVHDFIVNYTTRKDGHVVAPTKLTIEGSNDDASWIVLKDVTEGLPTGANQQATIDVSGDGTAYRYIRMRVYENNTGQKANEHYYFIVSELGISVKNLAANLNPAYASISSDLVLAVNEQVEAAKDVLATATTADELKAAVAALTAQYKALLAAKQAVETAELEAKKDELASLLGETQDLFDLCGAVTPVSATLNGALALQTTAPAEGFYLSTNADQNVVGNTNDGGGIAALLDGNTGTYMHTQWDGTSVGEDHYVQVALNDEMPLEAFTFTYATRMGQNATSTSPAPTKIELQGSKNGTDYVLMNTYTSSDAVNPLPSYTELGISWTSETIDNAEGYKYFRFVVKESDGPGSEKYNDRYFFAMSEFGFTADGHDAYTDIQYNEGFGGLTDAEMIAADQALAEAEQVSELATSAAQVEAAIVKLQRLYDKLFAATHFTLNMSQYEYAGLYLPYAATIPAEATAYIITDASADGVATLQAVEGNVLPANTAVIVNAPEGEYAFDYTSETATADVSANMLEGSLQTTLLPITDGYKYYIFGQKDGIVGLYLAQKYDAEGNAVAADAHGTQFKVSANKVYLPYQVQNLNTPLSFVFKKADATGICNDIKVGADAQAIYNIYGQRITKVVNSGIYIVNGQKRFIQVK